MNKKLLRKHIMEIRSHIAANDRAKSENLIFETLITMESFKEAQIISSFVSFRNEISMDKINQTILDSGKTLLLPFISSESKAMTFHSVTDLSQLVRNSFGILEPNPEIHPLFDPFKIECVLTPGVAFDLNGYRLGYGGGFYDRLFSTIEKTIPKIGIAFHLQVVDALPIESYDCPITHLVTEKGILTF